MSEKQARQALLRRLLSDDIQLSSQHDVQLLLAEHGVDVLALAGPVLRHRMALNFAARADGVTIDHVIERLCAPYA